MLIFFTTKKPNLMFGFLCNLWLFSYMVAMNNMAIS